MLLPENVAFATCSHWFCAFVFQNCGAAPAGTDAGSNGSVTVTGAANVVPCGVKANIAPDGGRPLGSGGAPADVGSISMCTSDASAPGGISIFAPLGPLTVPPAAPMTTPLPEL